MAQSRNKSASVENLVAQFEATALAQYRAIWTDQNAIYNRLYARMVDIRLELKARAGDQRRALVPLLLSDNVQVRLMAANTLLSIAPDLARKTLESVRDHGLLPQAADASMMLKALDDGSYVPD